MAAPGENTLLTAKFFRDDTVALRDRPTEFAVLVRCWYDAMEDVALPDTGDPLDRQLVRGEYGITFFTNGQRALVSESDLILKDRAFRPGDIVKQHLTDVMSGIVTETYCEVQLEHAITKRALQGWIPMREVELDTEVGVGDYVIHGNWIGTVQDTFEETTCISHSGKPSRIAEPGAHFLVGEKTTEILDPRYLAFLGNTERVVIATKPIAAAVSWLALNQSLPAAEAASIPRPKRNWAGRELNDLQRVVLGSYDCHRIMERVRFKDPEVARTRGAQPSLFPMNRTTCIAVDTLIVTDTRMLVTILWQDGTTSKHHSSVSVPHTNIDEYDCWPGDQVMWKGEDGPQAVVVQKVSPTQRTIEVMLLKDRTKETVSALEIDPQGPLPSIYGVRHGDMVLINLVNNGEQAPVVPRLGEIEPWIRTPGDGRNGWRTELAKLGLQALNRADPGDGRLRPATDVEWVGQVITNRLDGDIEIMLPSGKTLVEPLNKLSLLIDDVEEIQMDEWLEDEEGEEGDEMDIDGAGSDWSEGSWETVDHGEQEQDWAAEQEDEPPLIHVTHPDDIEMNGAEEPVAPGGFATPSGETGKSTEPTPTPPRSNAVSPPPPPTPAVLRVDSPNWERFVIQEQCPPDHHFANRESSVPGKAFLGRLQKEYKVLQSSLPETILVRAYEDRTDLLRCLIIGPDNTPYEDAPFVIDWYLEPTFPQAPPQAHFHSWTNGNGRVNPNLYEEGKVCLSILNTWTGDRAESWSAARSSLLQAFVSIQGLVLVKEPWFCEPAYEKLRGTQEAEVSSRLYSEKAYVLSRGFVRHALEQLPGGLENEVQWHYYDRHVLAKVIRDANELISKSEQEGDDPHVPGDRAVPRLTQGGILPLRRTLAKLQVLLDTRASAA
ncbi:hypothetical protein DACRYDRAFT_23552 [Dacryopinax primogenitus]|uniref:UBC core domain-containing protein n=1 Tax=Dacryopinax primogenitus (strain DJM 731) TaxID=1858805 RepID=M5G8C6_DACPD|nr:uncharacterized protein DACRYDRAFT_23552 [Dacryopinax primogenitus]EJU00013.1 hypothetical protein DACRYDRAFT_23552 [Dacryopinax primogenitus]